MSTLSEDSVVDQITIDADGVIAVRRADRVLRDDEVISQTYHRHLLVPGSSLEGEDAAVVAHAQLAWTEDVISAYQAKYPAE